jgi:trigger factor
VKTSVEELPENKVRLEVEVPEADVRHAFEHAASDLAGELRVPGFRKGKAPVQVVVARVGREALWEEALRSHLDGWFWNAAQTSGIQPVASPEVDLGDGLPAEGEPFTFTATVSVVARPTLADWKTLEVPAPEAEVPTELVDDELDRIREAVAGLAPVESRPVAAGDTLVIDLTGDDVPDQHDYVVEVGEGRLLEEIESALVGMRAGESKRVELAAEGDRTVAVDVAVKEIKEKVLPELDDDLARAASEFDTLAELRADIEERLREQLETELEAQFRQATVDALVAASTVEVADALVDRRAAELWNGIVRSLERRGLSAEVYLTMTGQSQSELVEQLRAEARQSLERELVLDAVAAELAIEVADEDVEKLVREEADAGDDPDETATLLKESGGWERLRSDLRLRNALDAVAGEVKRIPLELAHAREKLWTPEKEKGGTGMKIWTPGSEEAPKP